VCGENVFEKVFGVNKQQLQPKVAVFTPSTRLFTVIKEGLMLPKQYNGWLKVACSKDIALVQTWVGQSSVVAFKHISSEVSVFVGWAFGNRLKELTLVHPNPQVVISHIHYLKHNTIPSFPHYHISDPIDDLPLLLKKHNKTFVADMEVRFFFQHNTATHKTAILIVSDNDVSPGKPITENTVKAVKNVFNEYGVFAWMKKL